MKMKTRLQQTVPLNCGTKGLRPMNIGIRNSSAPNPAKWRDEFNCETECAMNKEILKGGI